MKITCDCGTEMIISQYVSNVIDVFDSKEIQIGFVCNTCGSKLTGVFTKIKKGENRMDEPKVSAVEEKKTVKHKVCEEALIIAADDVYKMEVLNPGLEDVLIGQGSNFEYGTKEEWLEDMISKWLEDAAMRLGV